MPTKTYTAQEMREAAEIMPKSFFCCERYADGLERILYGDDYSAMLRQAADTEEEIAKLKARLAAVVKYAKDNTWDESGEKNAYLETTTRIHNHDMRAIIRAARGEGGAE